jgi:hypothetical protein
MRLVDLRRLSGPNSYLSRPVVVARLELDELAGQETTSHAGFASRLLAVLPGLAGHHCAAGRPGGFCDAMARGTYFGHVTEHVALELSGLAGREVYFGRTERAGADGSYNVVMACPRDEPADSPIPRDLLTLGIRPEQTSAVGVDIACDKIVTKELLAGAGVPAPAGTDYRVLVVDGRVAAAAQLRPAAVAGDGVHDIQALVGITNADPRRGVGHARPLTRIAFDSDALAHLATQGLHPGSVPSPGTVVTLRRNANLSTGGTSTDVTDLIHPEVSVMCCRAAAAAGLDVCGVDLRLPDIASPMGRPARPAPTGAVIEVNACPGSEDALRCALTLAMPAEPVLLLYEELEPVREILTTLDAAPWPSAPTPSPLPAASPGSAGPCYRCHLTGQTRIGRALRSPVGHLTWRCERSCTGPAVRAVPARGHRGAPLRHDLVPGARQDLRHGPARADPPARVRRPAGGRRLRGAGPGRFRAVALGRADQGPAGQPGGCFLAGPGRDHRGGLAPQGAQAPRRRVRPAANRVSGWPAGPCPRRGRQPLVCWLASTTPECAQGRAKPTGCWSPAALDGVPYGAMRIGKPVA